MTANLRHPVIAVFSIQASGIEDAVLSLLGEQAQEAAEPTMTGTAEWARLDKIQAESETRAHSSKRVAVRTPFKFSARRSPDELPWQSLAP